MRTRLALGVAAAACAAGLPASCGDSSDGTSSGVPKVTLSDRDKVEQTVVAYYSADRKAVCASLSRSALRSLGGEQSCTSSGAERARQNYNIESIRLETGRATAEVRAGGKPVRLVLVDEAGEWKVKSPVPPKG